MRYARDVRDTAIFNGSPFSVSVIATLVQAQLLLKSCGCSQLLARARFLDDPIIVPVNVGDAQWN